MIELYEENLHTLINVLRHLQDVSSIEGVFDVEIRVRVDDVNTWAVVGWGESGDPCVLRFEPDKPIIPPTTGTPVWPSTINPVPSTSGTIRSVG